MGHEEHEHMHTHEHTHPHVHENGEMHSHPHAHEHAHEHDHPHTHEPLHDAEHLHHHDHSAPAASPRDELVALMKYMVGHNAAHIDELAALAKQLDSIGESDAYDRILHAVELFRHGNEHLAEVLKDLQ